MRNRISPSTNIIRNENDGDDRKGGKCISVGESGSMPRGAPRIPAVPISEYPAGWKLYQVVAR